MNNNVVIIGAGIAGLGCAHALRSRNLSYSIYEMRQDWGGLCDCFYIDKFRFDRFIHLSFSELEYVNKLFLAIPYYKHMPYPYSYSSGNWIKHPAQNNLYNLASNEKERIIADFINRTNIPIDDIKDYEQWLRCQYGDYFAKNFPMKYTKKYWTTEAKNLEVKWIDNRMYKPSLEEMKSSCYTYKTPNRYYAGEMRYPKKGGYKSFLSDIAKGQAINFKKEVVGIDTEKKEIVFSDGEITEYGKLVSSIPLPEYVKLIKNMPNLTKDACAKLAWTSGVLVSLGFNKMHIPKHLWYYIYDNDILPSRVYSPSLKSPDNAPTGCSSIQAEIFFSEKYKPLKTSLEEILKKTIKQLSSIMNFSKNDIICYDVRYEPYANIIFNHEIYENRKIVLDYLLGLNILPIGRFGEWEYFWSDQSLMSGARATNNI